MWRAWLADVGMLDMITRSGASLPVFTRRMHGQSSVRALSKKIAPLAGPSDIRTQVCRLVVEINLAKLAKADSEPTLLKNLL